MRFIFRHCGVLLCTPHSSSEFILSLSKDAPPQAGFRKAQLVPPVAGELVPSTLATFFEVIEFVARSSMKGERPHERGLANSGSSQKAC